MIEPDFSNSSEDEINYFYKTISNNVKKLREERNMTQQEIALDIGIKSIAFYSNCENNRYDKHFNLEHLYKIAKTLNVPIEELIKN